MYENRLMKEKRVSISYSQIIDIQLINLINAIFYEVNLRFILFNFIRYQMTLF